MLLTLSMLLALAASGGAHIARVLAQNQTFRENASTAASAGIEMAIRAIVTSPDPSSAPTRLSGSIPGSDDRFEAEIRLLGVASRLPQPPGERLQGASFEILGTGLAARGARDRQRMAVMWVVEAPEGTETADCEPLKPAHCHRAGVLERMSWQRVPLE